MGSAKSLGLFSDRAALNVSQIHVIDSLCFNIVAFTGTATLAITYTPFLNQHQHSSLSISSLSIREASISPEQ